MANITSGSKINHTDLPTLFDKNVCVRSLVDGSERRGIVKAYDSVNGKVRIDVDKSHFWASATNKSTEYVFVV